MSQDPCKSTENLNYDVQRIAERGGSSLERDERNISNRSYGWPSAFINPGVSA
jgi:hypothetical protein